MRKLLLVAIIAAISIPVYAKTVSLKDITRVSSRWLAEKNTKMSGSMTVSRIYPVEHKGLTVYYVVEFDRSGFLVLSAIDDEYPVQFYSYTARYEALRDHDILRDIRERIYSIRVELGHKQDPDEAKVIHVDNELLKSTFSAEELGNYEDKKTRLKQHTRDKWNHLQTNGDVTQSTMPGDSYFPGSVQNYFIYFGQDRYLTATRWGQHYPWNAEVASNLGPMTENVPIGSLGATDPECHPTLDPNFNQCTSVPVTGCVATAMGQLMKFWSWPNSYAWANMRDTNDPFGDAALLLWHAGITVHTSYHIWQLNSTAPFNDVGTALTETFFYDSSIKRYDSYSSDWYTLIREEIFQERPVLLSIRYNDGQVHGHSVVGDGYDEDDQTIHINMGWGGQEDGFYHLDSIASHAYSSVQVYTGIKPSYEYYALNKKGAIYCQNDNLAGSCGGTTSNIETLINEGRNEMISSLRVYNGWSAVFCKDTVYQSTCKEFYAFGSDITVSASQLRQLGLHDNISSVAVEPNNFVLLVPVNTLILN